MEGGNRTLAEQRTENMLGRRYGGGYKEEGDLERRNYDNAGNV